MIPDLVTEDLRGKLPVHSTKKYPKRKLVDIRSLAFHNSLTSQGDAFSFARYHVSKNNWPGIGYAYVILKDGTVQWCWDWDYITYHVGSSNRHALGICFVGDFRKEVPTAAQINAGIKLVKYLKDNIPTIKKVKGHNEYPGYSWKPCPGPNFPLEKFKKKRKTKSLIGKVVESETVALVNGNLLEEKVAIIEDKSYGPVRAIAEALGAKVDWDGRVLIKTDGR